MSIKLKKSDGLQMLIWIFFAYSQILKIGTVHTLLILITMLLTTLYMLKGKDNWMVVLFFLLVIQVILREETSGILNVLISYLDEMLSIVGLALVFIFSIKKVKFLRDERTIIICFLIYNVIGVLSSVINHNANIITCMQDILMCNKFIIFFLTGKKLIEKKILTKEKIFILFNKPCQYFSLMMFALAVHDLVLPPFFIQLDFRYFTKAFQLCFPHPTYLAHACVTVLCLLIYNLKYEKKNYMYIIFISFVAILTVRNKAIISIILIVLSYIFFVKLKLKGKKIIIILLAYLGIMLGANQIDMYFTRGTYGMPIRMKMLVDGISIAKDYFPIGAGFATFGTTVAYDSGSYFYYLYGYLSEYYRNQPVGDAFWPGVLSTSGFIGTAFFAIAVIFMVRMSLTKIDRLPYCGFAMLSIMIYMIISSSAETAFFNPTAAAIFLIFGVCMGTNCEIERK